VAFVGAVRGTRASWGAARAKRPVLGSVLAAVGGIVIAKLAVDSLVDGALHEGVSARIVAKLARQCEVPAITDALRSIAADEGRHSAHGFDVVEWRVAEGGIPVVSALSGAVSALPAEMRSPLPAAAVDGGWHKWGIHGRALEAAEYASARADLARRIEYLRVRSHLNIAA
jgi:hypothetical protein